MSKYTIQLRFVCEQASGLDESKGYNGVEKIIEKAAPKIFDFYYPIFDPSYRRALEEKILLHFYTREICEETIGLWKLRLKSKMLEIMPYYNQLYESTLLKFDPFTDIDYTLTHKGRANESKKQEAKTKHTADTDFTEGVKTVSDTDTVENINDNTVANEVEVTHETGNEVVTQNIDKVIDETTNTVTHTDDVKDTTATTTTERTLEKTVEISDTENTNVEENETSHTVAQKDGDNTRTVTDIGTDVDTTDIDETTVRTPDLNTHEKTNNYTSDYGTGFDARNIQRSEDTLTKQTEVGVEDGNGTKNYSDDTLDLHSDTPQGNLVEVDDGTGGAVTDGLTLRERIDSRYLTDARDVSSVHNETTTQHVDKSGTLDNKKEFDETTDDNITYTRNYKNDLDGTKDTDETGTETTDKTGHDVLTKEIDEVHTTHDLINETVTTDFTDNKTSDKVFTKAETDSTNETENTVENLTKNETEAIDTNTGFTRNQTENEKLDKNTDTVNDFNGTIDNTENYQRDKTMNMDYAGTKDTESRRNLLENIYDDIQHNIRNTDEYINHAVGKISDVTKSKMLLEYRETFLNIDQMIIEELEELFYLLY